MTTKSKRLILFGVAALLVIWIVSFFVYARRHGYRAISVIQAKSVTKSLYRPEFEQEAVKTMPGIIAVRVRQNYLTTGHGAFQLPHGEKMENYKAIYLLAEGPDAESACRKANEAATMICQTTLTNYDASGTVFQPANTARPYSFFHDDIQPVLQKIYTKSASALK